MARGTRDWYRGISHLEQRIGLYSQSEWAARTGIDKTFRADANDVLYDGIAWVDYVVPNGKTLYITLLVAAGFPTTGTGADVHVWVEGVLSFFYPTTVLVRACGPGGCVVPFVPPAVIEAGKTMRAEVRSRAYGTVHIRVTACGYEV